MNAFFLGAMGPSNMLISMIVSSMLRPSGRREAVLQWNEAVEPLRLRRLQVLDRRGVDRVRQFGMLA